MTSARAEVEPTSAADRRIRALRPPKPVADPLVAHGALVEEERRPGGHREQALTVFLTGAECPFTCAFCDLWRWTIDGATPPGALVRQLERVLAEHDGVRLDRLKLYNASNFFDARAVPSADLPAIARLADRFASVTVESHVNSIGPSALRFASQLRGRLEIAVGLETVHPVAAARLNKRLDLDRFARAARFLADNGIDLRVFVLLGAPHVPAAEAVEWTVRSVDVAAQQGAAVVSIIPVRGGNGEMERLQAIGAFTPPTLRQLEEALDACAAHRTTVVTADLWDAALLAGCESCRQARVARLARINVTGRSEPPVACDRCDR